MPDYAAMYKKLFQSQSKAILILQEAQQATEEMYISSEPPDIRVLETKKPEADAIEDSGAEASGEDKKDEV